MPSGSISQILPSPRNPMMRISRKSIFLDSGATLDFTDDKTLGLYGNLADYGADDIFANGNGTTIDLPDISQMQLSGFDVPTDELHWVEDYPTKDTKYDQGTNINTSDTATDELPERYRDAINALHQVYTIPGGQSLKCYTCLALGYELIFITIRKAGLENGSYPKADGVGHTKAQRLSQETSTEHRLSRTGYSHSQTLLRTIHH